CDSPVALQPHASRRHPHTFPTRRSSDLVPVLDFAHRNEAKRFILLIDVLYDHHARLFISADAPPEKLYQARQGVGVEAFEFDRTASRLFEMQSAEYLQAFDEKHP